MKKINIFNWALIIIGSIGGLILSIQSIIDGNLYRTLIRLSIIPVLFAPKIVNLFLKKKISVATETIYILFVFFAHFLGSVYDLYTLVKPYDKIMHWLSGIMTSFLATIILVKTRKYDKKSIAFNVIFIIAIALSVASLWEMFEYTNDIIFSKDAQRVALTGVNDTMQDMIVAFLGSLLFSIVYIYEEINNKKIIVKRYIEVISHE